MNSTFADLGVPEDIVACLATRGIAAPFPIQAATLADSLAGRDICGKAPTGSGKTLAFAIPMAARIPRAKPHHPTALVLVPTRELAAQVHRAIEPLARTRGRRVTSFYGGVGFGEQLKSLRQSVDIVVACPGRLGDLIERGQVQLSSVGFVVLDEADRMADMGFLPEVKRILDQVATQRQTLLFSATLDGEIDVLVRRYQTNPARHELEAATDDLDLAQHVFWKADRAQRVGLCAELISAAGPSVVFCRTKHGADRVAKQLNAAGISAAAIHGDRSQAQRERALAAFANRRVRALVATDVAARGIHVDGVGAVVHFDPPNDHKDYIHRSGRTARAGARGLVVSLIPDDMVKATRRMQSDLGMPRGISSPDVASLKTETDPWAGEATQNGPSPESSPERRRPSPPRPKAGYSQPRHGQSSAEVTGSPRPARPHANGRPSAGPAATRSRSGGSPAGQKARSGSPAAGQKARAGAPRPNRARRAGR